MLILGFHKLLIVVGILRVPSLIVVGILRVPSLIVVGILRVPSLKDNNEREY